MEPKKPDLNHVMIDIETLSSHPNAVIVSLGLVCFNPFEGIVDETSMSHFVFDIEKQIEEGRHVSSSTLSFWMKNGDAWPINSETTISDIGRTLDAIAYTYEDYQIWTHRHFDITVLENYWYTTMKRNDPLFNFRNLNDSNQLFRFARNDPREDDDLISHNAMDDAFKQANAVSKILSGTEPF